MRADQQGRGIVAVCAGSMALWAVEALALWWFR